MHSSTNDATWTYYGLDDNGTFGRRWELYQRGRICRVIHGRGYTYQGSDMAANSSLYDVVFGSKRSSTLAMMGSHFTLRTDILNTTPVPRASV